MSLDNPLWHYALELYGRPGVESAVLTLQRCGCSVNRLLYACWLAREGRRLEPDMLAGEALEWQQTLTHPLRALRYQVRGRKEQQPLLETCYRRLREAELAAEQVELMLLWQQGQHAPSATAGRELAWHNLKQATQAAELSWSQLRSHLQPLVQAAFPSASGQALNFHV